MKKYLDKSPFLFVLASFMVLGSLGSLISIIGAFSCASTDVAIDYILRNLPLFFTTVGMYIAMSLSHLFRMFEDTEKAPKMIRVRAVLLIVFGGIAALYVILCHFSGIEFRSLLETGVIPFYPIAMMILGILEVLDGVLFLFRVKKLKKGAEKENLSCDTDKKRIRYNTQDKPIVGLRVFAILFLLAAMYSLGAALTAPFYLSWTQGHGFYNVTLTIMFFMPSVYVFIWKFFYLKKDGKERTGFKIRVGLMTLCLGFVALVLYLTAVKADLSAHAFSAMSLLPVDFFAGANTVCIIYSILLLIPPIIYTASGIHEYGKE